MPHQLQSTSSLLPKVSNGLLALQAGHSNSSNLRLDPSVLPVFGWHAAILELRAIGWRESAELRVDEVHQLEDRLPVRRAVGGAVPRAVDVEAPPRDSRTQPGCASASLQVRSPCGPVRQQRPEG